VLRDLFRQGAPFEAGNRLVERQLALMRERRAVVIDGLSTGMDLIAAMPTLRVNSYELEPAFDAYLLRRGPTSPVKSLGELISSGRYLKGGTQEARYKATMSGVPLDADPEYLSRLATQRVVRRLLIDLMDRYQVDALAYPVKSLGAPPIGTSDDGPRDNAISSTTGLPAIVLPAGLNDEGLPIAIELLGRPFSEPKLMQLAYALEQAGHARVAPKIAPHLPGDVFSY
jgi:Asp-tRNA(Asn)/Glu-tRNA(Gln) amidotransferase A subunit family amidase